MHHDPPAAQELQLMLSAHVDAKTVSASDRRTPAPDMAGEQEQCTLHMIAQLDSRQDKHLKPPARRLHGFRLAAGGIHVQLHLDRLQPERDAPAVALDAPPKVKV